MIFFYIIAFVLLVLYIIISISNKSQKLMLNSKRKFRGEIYNELYNYSFVSPFKYFIPEKEKDKNAVKLTEQINQAELTEKFNYRSFIVLKLMLLFFGIILFSINLLLLENLGPIVKFLFNVKDFAKGANLDTKILIALICICISIIPSIYLKYKAKNNLENKIKDIPVLQLFIISMYRSNRSVREILYVLGRTNTRYKEIFQSGFRIFVRDEDKGFNYINSKFKGTKFEDTLKIIRQSNDYSKSEIIRSLENNMQETIEFNNQRKQSANVTKLLYTDASFVIPFIGTACLTFVPLAIYGISLASNSNIF